MGAAASTLTPAQKEEMAKLVKLEQEANPNATQDEIDAIMAQKYKDNLAEALTANAAGAPLSSGPGAHAKKKNASKPVRRRSFGNETRHVSKSTPGLPTVEGATGDDAIASAISAVAEGTPAADEPPKRKCCFTSMNLQRVHDMHNL